MRNYYEILLALIVSSKEEDIKELLERLEKAMNEEGAVVEQIQRLDRKEFAYPHKHLTSAFYVNCVITAEPTAIDKIRKKLKLMEEVTLQNYFRKETIPTEGTPVKASKVTKTKKAPEPVAAA